MSDSKIHFFFSKNLFLLVGFKRKIRNNILRCQPNYGIVNAFISDKLNENTICFLKIEEMCPMNVIQAN